MTTTGLQTTREINSILLSHARNQGRATVTGLAGQDSVAVGLDFPAEILLEGSAGDYFGALNAGAKITLKGKAGRFAGDTVSSGTIVIEGSCDHGLGFSMYGGAIVVRGGCGGRIGQMNKAGLVIIGGDAGDLNGLYQLGGSLIICGNTGNQTGDWLVGGEIFVGGKIGGLGRNARVAELEGDDASRLGSWFEIYEIDADPSNFRKIVPEKLRPFYKGTREEDAD